MSAEKALSQISWLQFHPVATAIILAISVILICIIIGKKVSVGFSSYIVFPILVIAGIVFTNMFVNIPDSRIKDLQNTPTRIVSSKTIHLEKITYSNKTAYFEKSKSKISYFTKDSGHLKTHIVPKSAMSKFLASKNPNQKSAILTIQKLKYKNKKVLHLLQIHDESTTKLNYIFVYPQK